MVLDISDTEVALFAFHLRAERAQGLPKEIVKHIQSPPMRHADLDMIDTKLSAHLTKQLQPRK
jgi:hypothetical protein